MALEADQRLLPAKVSQRLKHLALEALHQFQ